MKRILYTILTAAAILVGNYFFSNGTLEASVETPVSTVTPIAVIPTQVASLENTCPIPTADTKLQRNDNDGYCLLYPSYSTSLTGLIVINPRTNSGGDMPGDAWVSIQTETDGNRTVAQVADERIASVGTGFTITRKDVMVDGEQAVVVDGLPGQDSTRYVFIVHSNRLYTFEFAPWYPNATTPTPLENLYATVITSLHFLPSNTPPAIAGVDISDMGTSFIYPFGLANGTQDEFVPQSSSDAIWKSPAHAQFTLQGYPLQNTTYQPQILIYPADQYAQLGDQQKSIIERLQNILNTQNFSPQPIPDMFITNRPQEGLPFLPLQGAGQVFHAQEKFLSFQNGSGIRYVTQLGQAAFPLINNQDIFYTFQGLTSDGKYYVSIIMPINLPYLAANYGPDAYINPTDVQNADKYPGYVSDTIARLNQPEGEGTNPYAPSLASLDTLIQSMLVGLPATSETSPASSSADVSYMGTSFTIPLGLANGTQNEIVPQTSPNEPMLVWPTHTKIVLQGYPLQDTLYKPQILIFPADEYQKMSADPATSQNNARTTISTLQYILSTQKFIFQDPLPMLPDQHAYQLLYAQETILSFKNGSGIRYITSYSQAAFPDIGSNLIYSFQGITPDGKYYVSVMMPIELAGLDPAPANAEQYPNYLNTTVDRLRQAGNPFNPSIESLDALAESLLVGLPATSDMTPATAEPTASAQVDGLWITNVGKLNLKQNGPEVTGTTDSYGDTGRQDTLQGTLNGNTVTLNSQMLGDLNLTFSDNTFKTADGSRVAFCGIRASESNELPPGCGFSGKWILTANSFFPGSSFVVLTQTAGNVSGDFYDGKGNNFDKLTGQVSWGKGWWLGGKNEKGHTITLMMNSFETGFEYIYDDLFQLQLCAVRDGLNSADLGNFICSL